MKNLHLHGLLMGHKKNQLNLAILIWKWGLKGSQIVHIWKLYRYFFFHPLLMGSFLFALTVVRASSIMSTDFLYLNSTERSQKVTISKFEHLKKKKFIQFILVFATCIMLLTGISLQSVVHLFCEIFRILDKTLHGQYVQHHVTKSIEV